MWKDFFYFSRGQRISILFLLVVIILSMAGYFVLPILTTDVSNHTDTTFLNEARRFQAQMILRDSVQQKEWNKRFQRDWADDFARKTVSKQNYSLFDFDPNKADSLTLLKLGLKNYVVSNILKFRKRGGTFRDAAAFSKVYGLQPEKFSELEPYIRIETALPPKAKDSISITRVERKVAGKIVDLNSADTTELMQVQGIGRGYAKNIVRFRQQTGGFVSVDQLREIYGMSDANFQKISPYCKVNLALVRKININTATVDKLKNHPYVNFYQAKSIYEWRRRKGKLKSEQDLKNVENLTAEDIKRISPYLSFD